MSDPNRDLEKKLIKYLEDRQYERLQFEIEMMGDIETSFKGEMTELKYL